MMLYKNMKVNGISLNGNMDFFDTVTIILHGDKLVTYQIKICKNYTFLTSIDLMK